MSTKEYKEKIKVRLKSKNEFENKFRNKFDDKYEVDESVDNRIYKSFEDIYENQIEDEFENQVENQVIDKIDNIFESNSSSRVEDDSYLEEGTNPDIKPKSYSAFEFIIDVIKYTVLIYALTSLFTSFVMQRTTISGWSMENSLYEGDNLIVEKVSHHFIDLERFDIVAFYPNGKMFEEYYIKRIIGLPGEHVQILEDDIYINGILLEENYGKIELIGYAGIAKNGILLEEDEYFVMGDNRIESYDSRYEDHGPINLDKIEGKAILRIWPINRFGPID